MARPTATATPARRPSLLEALRAERHPLAAAHNAQSARDGPRDYAKHSAMPAARRARHGAPPPDAGARARQMAFTSKTW